MLDLRLFKNVLISVNYFFIVNFNFIIGAITILLMMECFLVIILLFIDLIYVFSGRSEDELHEVIMERECSLR